MKYLSNFLAVWKKAIKLGLASKANIPEVVFKFSKLRRYSCAKFKKKCLVFIMNVFLFLSSNLVRSQDALEQQTCSTGLSNCLINCDEVFHVF